MLGKHALAVHGNDIARNHANEILPLEPRKNRTRIAKDYGQSRTLEGNIEAHRLDRSVPRVARNGIVVPPSFLRFLELGVAEVGNDVKP